MQRAEESTRQKIQEGRNTDDRRKEKTIKT